MANEGRQQDRKLTVFQRQQEALELRGRGKSYDEIAVALGYKSRSSAFKSVKSAMTKLGRESVAELRTLEDRRLDDLQDAIWPMAMKGKPGSVRAALAVSESRRRLWGVDAPSKIEIGRFAETESWRQISEAIKQGLEPYPEAAAAVAGLLRELEV